MMNKCLLILFAFMPALAVAQDYALYETQYLTPLPGHAGELSLALERHNERFHAEGPYAASVSYIANGPRSNDYFWVMGPSVYSDYDHRPTGDPHDSDWSNSVMAHASPGEVEYWIRNDELSYTPEGSEDEDRPLNRVRFFEVSDNALFQELQSQIMEVQAAMGSSRPRSMYQKQFLHNDGRDWASVVSFSGWSELDDEGGNFQETFREVHGDDAWSTFLEQIATTVISREDEWQELIPELSASNTGADD